MYQVLANVNETTNVTPDLSHFYNTTTFSDLLRQGQRGSKNKGKIANEHKEKERVKIIISTKNKISNVINRIYLYN